MTLRVVTRLEGMTGEWFAALLTAAGVLGDAEVESVSIEPVSGGVMTSMARVKLSYLGATNAPRSLLVKYPSDDAGNLGIARTMGLYELEVRFYQEIAPRLRNLKIPKCYFAHFEQGTGRFVLALEDLGGATKSGSSLDTLTKDECSAVLGELVNFQAPLWNSRELSQFGSLDDNSRTLMIFDSIPAGLDPFLTRFGHALDPDFVRLFEAVLPLAGEWARSWTTPKVLQHGEFRSGNILFGVTDDAPPVTVIDFQTVRIGPPGVDPAYFMGASMPVDDRRKMERDLIADYHARLMHAGVTGFDLDACWRTYREGAMYGVFLLVGMAGQVEPSERNDQVILGLVQRLAAMALDLDAAQAAGLA